MSDTNELGPVIHVSAEAIGQPGQRRFRLRALTEAGPSVSRWLEKEQLNSLGDAIDTVLEDQDYPQIPRPLDDLEPEPVFPLNFSIDFRVAQLSMGLNRDLRLVVLIASDAQEPDAPGTTSISFEFDYQRAYELRTQITSVVAAGRPPCPLCSGPMDPEGHVCVRTNGHNPH
jgi:uncharacterized repeat protein (TIGR03847 family)